MAAEGTSPGRVARLRDRVASAAEPLRSTTVGRIGLDAVERAVRVEIFDRAMVIAAQVFTSVIPILILLAVAARGSDLRDAMDSLGAPGGVRDVIDQAVSGGPSLGSFGVLGVVFVLVSSTSLSRALARTYAAVWELPRPAGGATAAWRWLAVAVAFALSVLAVRFLSRLGDLVPPAPVWSTLAVAAGYVALLWPASRVLLAGQVPWRALLPGAVLGALAMSVVSRVSQQWWLPGALAASEARYGPLGVTFTYLSLLYVLAWILIAAVSLGAALVLVDGPVARWAAGRDGRGGAGR